MSISPFSLAGTFRRGNLHTHSTLSDGGMAPEHVCEFYAQAGYDFLALTDHFMEQYGYVIADTTRFRTPSFTTLIGAELHTGRTELNHLWHILAVGLPLDFAANLAGETGPEIAARALKAGAFVAAPHPAWYGLTETDVRSLGDIHAIEIFNGTSCDHNDRPESWYMMDLMTMRGHRYTACATDDAHFKAERYDALRGWVQVKCRHNEPEPLLEALKAGNYYASTGPQIHDVRVEADGDTLTIRCSPAERVFVTGYGWKAQYAYGVGMRHAEFSIKQLNDSPYYRITVRDDKGGRAWTNPVWL